MDFRRGNGYILVMKKIDAVEMVRTIRDKQLKDTLGKSPQETIDYFRAKAAKIAGKKETDESSKRSFSRRGCFTEGNNDDEGHTASEHSS